MLNAILQGLALMSCSLTASHRGLRGDKKSLIYISFLEIHRAPLQERRHSALPRGSSAEKAKTPILVYLTEVSKRRGRLIGCRTILPAAIGNFHGEVKALQGYKG